jgi:5-methylcytosine-specific restriction enzyme subunit McrC
MHALCRFFLESTGPSVASGTKDMLPFLMDMARLFEMFVAQWLRKHLPPGWTLQMQEPVQLPNSPLRFDIDLVLYDEMNQARCVMDTKYKAPTTPATDDVTQVVAYAAAKDCTQAFLLYPTPSVVPLHTKVGQIEVHSFAFDLNGDLVTSGTALRRQLFSRLSS